MTSLGATTAQAAVALTAFWASVTLGRLLFASVGRWLPSTTLFRLLPIVLVGTFVLTAVLPADQPWLGVAVFALAGLGCSALLPLTISLGQGALASMSAALAGGVIAFYQVGYGVAAFGVGPLVDAGIDLSALYGWTAAAAAVLAMLAFVIVGRQRGQDPSGGAGHGPAAEVGGRS
jgi:predicted MFS family arabinose efflux permease